MITSVIRLHSVQVTNEDYDLFFWHWHKRLQPPTYEIYFMISGDRADAHAIFAREMAKKDGGLRSWPLYEMPARYARLSLFSALST